MKIKKLLMRMLCLCMLALVTPMLAITADAVVYPALTKPTIDMLLPDVGTQAMTESSAGIWEADVEIKRGYEYFQFYIVDSENDKCFTTSEATPALDREMTVCSTSLRPDCVRIALDANSAHKVHFKLDTNGYDTSTGTGAKLTVTAEAIRYYEITASSDGEGNTYGTGTYKENSSVTVTAQPGGASTFLYWTENGEIVSYEEEYTFTVTADRNLKAVYQTCAKFYMDKTVYNAYDTIQFTSNIPSGHAKGTFTLYVNGRECKDAAGNPISLAYNGQTVTGFSAAAADLLMTTENEFVNWKFQFKETDGTASYEIKSSSEIQIKPITQGYTISNYLNLPQTTTVAYDGTGKKLDISSQYQPGESALYLAPEQITVTYEAASVSGTETPVAPGIYSVRITVKNHPCYDVTGVGVNVGLIIDASAPIAAVDAKTGNRVAADFTVYSRYWWENNGRSHASVTTTTDGEHTKISDLEPNISFAVVFSGNEDYVHSSGVGFFTLNQDGTVSVDNDADNMLTMENGVLTAKLNKRNTITKKTAANGTYLATDAPNITTELSKAAVGTKVYLTAEPEILAKLRSFTVTGESGAEVEVTMTGENTGYFTMPDEPVTAEALFYIWHTHDWEYTVTDKTISASCVAPECPISNGGSVTISATDSVYDGAAKPATLSAQTVGGIQGLQSLLTYNGEAAVPVDAGTYTAQLTVDTDKTISVTYTVAPRNITVTADDQTIAYAGALTENAVTVTEGTLAATDTLTSVTLTPSTTNATDNGTITPSAAVIKTGSKDVTANYTVTYKPGKLTVTKATSSVAFNGYAPGKTYDAKALDNPTAQQLTITGAVYSDVTFTWYKDSVAEGNKLTAAPADAGTYYVVASIADTANTTASGATSDAIVIDRLDISGAIIYEYRPLSYTGEEQTNAVTGVKVGNVVVDDYTVTGNTGTNANIYTMTVTGNGNFTGSATKLWAIDRKTMTVTADDKAVAVGDAMPELTYTVEGLIGEDTLTTLPVLDCVADMNTQGEYAITVTGGDAGTNYWVTKVDGTLSVRQKHAVTVAAAANGTASASCTEAIEGTQITVTTAPASGYRVASAKVTKADGSACAVSAGMGGSYTFTMPGETVTVTVTFEKIPVSTSDRTPGSPDTGDGAMPALLGAVMLSSLLCAAALVFGKKYSMK